MLKIILYEHYRANVTDTSLMVEPLPWDVRLKLCHNIYNHGITPIVHHLVNDVLLKNAKLPRRRE